MRKGHSMLRTLKFRNIIGEASTKPQKVGRPLRQVNALLEILSYRVPIGLIAADCAKPVTANEPKRF